MPKDPRLPDKDKVNIFKTILRTIKYYHQNSPWTSWVALALVIVNSGVPTLSNWISSKLLDQIVLSLSDKSGLNPQIVNTIIIFLIVIFAKQLLENIYYGAKYYTQKYFSLNHESNLVKKSASLEMEHYDSPGTNDIIDRAWRRHENVGRLYDRVLDTSKYVLDGAVSAIVLSTLAPILIVLTVLGSLPALIVTTRINKKAWLFGNSFSERWRDSSWTSGKLRNAEPLMEVLTYNLRRFLINRYYKINKEWADEMAKIDVAYQLSNSVLGIIDVITSGAIMLIIIGAILNGDITVGLFTFYWSASGRLSSAVSSVMGRMAGIQQNSLDADTVYKMLDLKQKIKSGHVVLKKGISAPIIKFNKVSFKYPDTKKFIVKDFDLTITPGERIAIVGENGAGKTTLIKLLLRFYDVSSGEITINGVNIKDLDTESWYKQVGTLFQEYNFYHFDAKTNIGVGDVDKLNELDTIRQSAQKSGADEFIQRYDNKYDQVLNKAFTGGINPSVGQQQKIALARAFFKDSPILILDEPTSAIDPKAEFEIFETLFEFAKQKTVIIISHRFSTVRNANKIIVLDNGKIVESGTHEELMDIDGGKYQHAFNLQKRGYE